MRPEKQFLLDEISDLIHSSKAMIIAKHDRLTPQKSWNFAEELSKTKSCFKVLKKRLFYKAAEKKEIDLKDKVEGHMGVIFIEGDPLEASKTVVKFQNENKGLLEIVTGQIDNKIYSSQDIITLSKLPSKDEMRAQLLGLFEAPMAQTLSVIESLLASVIYCLENKENK